MGSANYSPDLSAERKTIEDKLDKDALQRGKKFTNYQANAYHVHKDEKKESWTHLGPDLKQEHPVVTTPIYPTLCYAMLSYPTHIFRAIYYYIIV